MHRLPGILLLISIVCMLLSDSPVGVGPVSRHDQHRVLDVFGFETWEEVACAEPAPAGAATESVLEA